MSVVENGGCVGRGLGGVSIYVCTALMKMLTDMCQGVFVFKEQSLRNDFIYKTPSLRLICFSKDDNKLSILNALIY